MAQHCAHLICGSEFADKPCKCYSNLDENNLKGLTPAQRTARINSDQFCGYVGLDGVIYGCDAKCCADGCPGECIGVGPRPPNGIAPPNATVKKVTKATKAKAKKATIQVFNIAIVLLILMSLAILIVVV